MSANVRSSAPASSPAAATVAQGGRCDTSSDPAAGSSVRAGGSRVARIWVCKVAPRFAAPYQKVTSRAARARAVQSPKSGATCARPLGGRSRVRALLRTEQVADALRALEREQRALDGQA